MPFLMMLPTAALVESFMLILQPTVMSQPTTSLATDKLPLTISLLTDNVPLTDSLVTDMLLTHKLFMQFVTVKLATTSLVADRFPTVRLAITSSTIDRLRTHKLSTQLKTAKSVTVNVPSIVTFFLNFADLSTFNLP